MFMIMQYLITALFSYILKIAVKGIAMYIILFALLIHFFDYSTNYVDFYLQPF